MKKTSELALHPFFIASYPILFLLANNISQINPKDLFRPLVISLLFTLFFTLIFSIAAKDHRQGGLSASIIVGLFFTYGHIHRALGLENHAILLLAWVLLLAVGMLAKYRIKNINSVIKSLNIITFLLLLQPIFTILIFLSQSGIPQKIKPPSPFDGVDAVSQNNSDLPDIYYIIPDAYGRSDVVKELYDYDNSDFINFLEARGFYIAEKSHSNYIQTSLSLSSSMNLDYLENLEEADIQSSDREPLKELIHHSELRQFLEERGYQTIGFSTGYALTTISDADFFIPYHVELANDLENLILMTSATRAFGDKMQNLFLPFYCESQRGGIMNIFENLEKVPALPGPKFVFVHIMAPHPPFVFDAEGNTVKYGDCNGLDGTEFAGSREEYKTGYPQQMAYTSTLLEKTIENILENSATPPVIIIQGDHGSGMFLDFESLENTCLRERTSILNAYYLPTVEDDIFYETITPVNSFRIVLNEIFDLDLELLEDKIYFSPWEKLYQAEEVTDKIESSCE
ncbi:MAG: hypothetical protein HN736_01885 [Anaerolineae bacterium]|nr:hypothetical protein [Anaerolineae bacterium]MBT3714105.1 hypothetical protein [Anaerolineae bacterium]MBT4309464.1 hypothetical protein [Anaerolineae bacterium]MBT4458260.1 hypothetical protein [Anaerolineae bacterium]MBT4840985.1 hypothetical protein [Anaerolineae bacterium]